VVKAQILAGGRGKGTYHRKINKAKTKVTSTSLFEELIYYRGM